MNVEEELAATRPIEIPDDLVPTRQGWDGRAIAGIVTGGVLLAITVALVGVGVALTQGGWG